MKRTMFCVLLISVTTLQSLFSQVDTVKAAEQFLFPDFSVGVVRMKDTKKVTLELNYNIVMEKMVFRQQGKVFEVVNQMSIDTVYINNRKFIPQPNMFYEVLVTGPARLFVQHKGSVIKPSRPAAYGGTTEASSTTYINNMNIGNQVFRMDTKREVKIKYDPIYILEKDAKTYLITSQAHLLKALKDKKAEVRGFINSEKTDFSDPLQVAKVVTNYNRLQH